MANSFPSPFTISPQVRFLEIDNSLVAGPVSTSISGIVGFASKGPINVPTLISTVNQLHTVFGLPHPSVSEPYMIYAGEQYLQISTVLWVVRVADTNPTSPYAAQTAQIAIPGAGGQVLMVGNVVGPYVFPVNKFMSFRLNTFLSSRLLVILAGTYTLTQLITALNAQLNPPIDGIMFYATSNNTLGIETTFSYGPNASIELLSISNSFYGPGSIVGLGTLMTEATITGTAIKYPNNSYQVSGTYDLTGIASATLNIVIDGTGNVNIDNVVQQIVLPSTSSTISTIVSYINNLITLGTIPGGFVASVASSTTLKFSTLAVGENSILLVKPNSTVASVFGLATTTNFGTSPTATSGALPDLTYTAGIVYGSSVTNATTTFTLTADSPGIEGNSTYVTITNDATTGDFNFSVFNSNGQVEAFGPLTKNQASTNYLVTYLLSNSNYLRAVDVTSNPAVPAAGTYYLTGGTDGIPVSPDAQDALLIGGSSGTPGFNFATGMQLFSSTETINIDLFAVPGHSSTAVALAIINLCQVERGDCLGIIDPPFGYSVQEIVQWQNGADPLNTVQFNSSCAALYYPWVQIYDIINRINVWVPPSTVILGAIANSDNLSAPWFAPAGPKRGLLPNVTSVYTQTSLSDRDYLYGNNNAVNPITHFSDIANYVIWGQKTLLRQQGDALNRINVRRMLFYIEKQITAASKQFLFEPNDPQTRQNVVNVGTAILKQVYQLQGIGNDANGRPGYAIQCDVNNNPADVVALNELRVSIWVVPEYAIEYVYLTFTLESAQAFATQVNVNQ